MQLQSRLCGAFASKTAGMSRREHALSRLAPSQLELARALFPRSLADCCHVHAGHSRKKIPRAPQSTSEPTNQLANRESFYTSSVLLFRLEYSFLSFFGFLHPSWMQRTHSMYAQIVWKRLPSRQRQLFGLTRL
ncbi:hypothetical protein F1559_001764 [Cyanidiococcus yangmingshanensis]|uniref:Uncharacterized protein n=1 Tax=Cyanidiococcus yangmingshanensis TaxID=2690220 RepID=A0A7J7IG89_9RHOD|nr:hypothetical protein F1559_001764 [Cyanidiococcus yangmingshanensis]